MNYFGPYTLVQKLGAGVYGTVWKISDDKALKIIIPDKDELGIPELSELNALNKIKHVNILEIFKFTIINNQIGLELPLAKYDLAAASKDSGNIVHLKDWFYNLLSGIFFIHKNGLYHCDIKEANCLILNDNRLVISDLGLVRNKNIESKDYCQSYASPQLLYRQMKMKRSDALFLKYAAIPLIKNRSNEFQDDIWAVGLTIYSVLQKFYKGMTRIVIYNDVEWYMYYVSKRSENQAFKYFLTNGLPEKYSVLLDKLLHPDPEHRSFNLLELLTTPLFQPVHNYVDGTIIEPFIESPVLSEFATLAVEIKEQLLAFEYTDYLKIQLLDLIFRTKIFINQQCEDKGEEYRPLYKFALEILILQIAKFPVITPAEFKAKFNDFFSEDFDAFQKELVDYLKGIITRTTFADYIDPKFYKKCLDWIIENPERYDQLSVQKLVQHLSINVIGCV